MRDKQHSYWRCVHGAAFQRAKSRAGWTVLNLVVALGSVVAVIWGFAVWGSPDAAKDELIGRSVVAAFFALVLFVQYLFWVTRIPPEMDAEKAAEIEALRDRLRSNIRVEFDRVDGDYIVREVRTNAGGLCTYFRARVVNEAGRSEKNVQVFLNRVVRKTDNGTKNVISEPQRLIWSNEIGDVSGSKEIKANMSKFFDIAVQFHGTGGILPCIPVIPTRYEGAFADEGEYVFSIAVRGDDTAQADIDISILWDGNSDTVDAWEIRDHGSSRSGSSQALPSPATGTQP